MALIDEINNDEGQPTNQVGRPLVPMLRQPLDQGLPYSTTPQIDPVNVPDLPKDIDDAGSGLSRPASPAGPVASSSPSSSPAIHGHGQDHDIYSHLPSLQLPDISSMPETGRIQSLQSELDDYVRTGGGVSPPTMKGKILRSLLEAAPIAIGAATGGSRGAGSAAEGINRANTEQWLRGQQNEGRLLSEIGQAQQSRMGQYTAATHAALADQQLKMNALWHDAMIGSRDYATDTRSGTQLELQGMRDNATAALRQAQTDLANARTKGLPDQIRMAEENLKVRQKIADAFMLRSNVQQDSLESQLFGTYRGEPIPGMPIMTDDSGNPMTNPSTGQPQVEGTRPFSATGPTAATKGVLQQGGAIETAGQNLVSFIKSHRNEIGPVMGRVNNFESLLGTQGETFNQLRGLFESWIALHPKFHGFRGTQAIQQFSNAIGGYKTNPDAFVSSIEGMMKGVHEAGRGMQRPAVPRYAPPPSSGAPTGGAGARPPGW